MGTRLIPAGLGAEQAAWTAALTPERRGAVARAHALPRAGATRTAVTRGAATTESEEERALVLAALAGNEPAREAIVRRYYLEIYGLTYRLLNDRQDAEDATQDVFVRAFRRLNTFRRGARFRTWLQRIAVNRCIEIWRWRRTGAGSSTSLDDCDEAPAPGRDPQDEVVIREGMRVVQHGIRHLPEHYRLPLILFHHHGMAYEQIAEVLNLRVGTVRTRLNRGREMLRTALEGRL